MYNVDAPMSGEHWCCAEDEYLTTHYPTKMPIIDIAAALGRGEWAVQNRAHKLKLKRPSSILREYLKSNPRSKIRKERPSVFSDLQKEIILRDYQDVGPAELSRQLSLNKNSIISWARKRGLCRPIRDRYPKGKPRTTSAYARGE